MASAAAEAVSLEVERYSRVAMWFHWVIAALIVVNLLIGFFHEDFSKPVRGSLIFFHKSTGLAILALSLGRLGWRLLHRPPAFAPVLKRWEIGLALAVHWTFYLLMIGIPISGWLLVSGSGRPTSFFGLFDLPALPVSKASHGTFAEAHELLGYAILVLVVMHVGGAIKHRMDGHGELVGRMGPWLYRGS